MPPVERFHSISVTALRPDLALVLDRVLYAHCNYIVSKHGKAVAAIVPMAKWKLLNEVQDAAHAEDVAEMIEEPPFAAEVAEIAQAESESRPAFYMRLLLRHKKNRARQTAEATAAVQEAEARAARMTPKQREWEASSEEDRKRFGGMV